MFQFGGLTSDIIGYSIARVGCPIRIFADQRLFAPPRNFSQLITSFFVSESQGILRTPLLTFFYLLYLQVNLVFTSIYFSQYVKELYNSSFHFQGTEPAFLSASGLCELNVDISWTRTTYLCATAYPCLKKFQVQSFKFQVCFNPKISAS